MTGEDFTQKKQQLRREMRTLLESLSESYKSTASQQICLDIQEWLAAHPEIKTVATFANLLTEPDLASLLVTTPHIEWVYPHAKPSGQMAFHRVSQISSLATGLYGILQPKDKNDTRVTPAAIDCFLCPGYAFTELGDRLGKGGGYYDRLLAHRSAESRLIGVAFNRQLLEALPTEAHDIKVERVITD